MKTDSKEASAESFEEGSSERRAHTIKNVVFKLVLNYSGLRGGEKQQ